MAKYDLKLKTTDAGTQKARTLTLSNVNPEASANTLKLFTQQLNQLTTNTYVETDYIVTTNLDTETPPIDTRQTPTLSINPVPNLAAVRNGAFPTVTTDSDGLVYARRKTGCANTAFLVYASNTSFGIVQYLNLDPQGGTYVVGVEGTDNYKPIEVEYTLAE